MAKAKSTGVRMCARCGKNPAPVGGRFGRYCSSRCKDAKRPPRKAKATFERDGDYRNLRCPLCKERRYFVRLDTHLRCIHGLTKAERDALGIPMSSPGHRANRKAISDDFVIDRPEHADRLQSGRARRAAERQREFAKYVREIERESAMGGRWIKRLANKWGITHKQALQRVGLARRCYDAPPSSRTWVDRKRTDKWIRDVKREQAKGGAWLARLADRWGVSYGTAKDRCMHMRERGEISPMQGAHSAR
jgi:hypothetical protein